MLHPRIMRTSGKLCNSQLPVPGRQVCHLHVPAAQVKQRTLWSRYFEVGGYDWRLLVYPSGDSQALPGYISLYVQVGQPAGRKSISDMRLINCIGCSGAPKCNRCRAADKSACSTRLAACLPDSQHWREQPVCFLS